MCVGNCKNCTKCNQQNADGAAQTYDPLQVGQWLAKYFPFSSNAELKEAYTKAMVFFDSKGISPSEENIKNNQEALKEVFNDPDYLHKQAVETNKLDFKPLLGVVLIAIAFFLLIRQL